MGKRVQAAHPTLLADELHPVFVEFAGQFFEDDPSFCVQYSHTSRVSPSIFLSRKEGDEVWCEWIEVRHFPSKMLT